MQHFANDRNFFWPILCVSPGKSVFVWFSDAITNFKFRVFFIRIFIVFSIRISLCVQLKNLVFQRPKKSFSNNRFSFIVCLIHFNVIYFQKSLKRIIVKFTTLINPYFIWFAYFWDYLLKSINNSNSSFVF